jgi:Phosphoesterase family/Lactonase, 7-bladed beta-propeller
MKIQLPPHLLKMLVFGYIITCSLFACVSPKMTTAFDTSLYQTLKSKRLQLPNGWHLTPAGRSTPLGDFPSQIVVAPDRQHLSVIHNGVGAQWLGYFDTNGQRLDSVAVAKLWYGLAFNANGSRLYASGGNDNNVLRFRRDGQKWWRDTSFSLRVPFPKGRFSTAGVAVDEAHDRLFALGKDDSTLVLYDLKKNNIEQRLKLSDDPYAVCLTANGADLLVSLWGGKAILLLDAATLAQKARIEVGDHPNEMILNRDNRTLYVANSLDNAVAVVDLPARHVMEVLNTALYPNAPNGSTPNSLALSEDEKTLYIANADNSCLSVYDVSKRGASVSKGFIPTGWYPTSVRVVGKNIFVANGKGEHSKANPEGPSPYRKREDGRAAQYIGALFEGSLSVIAEPTTAELAAYTKLVYENVPYSKEKELNAEGMAGNPIPRRVGDTSPIKYVFYIIKENRTYDQVFGDLSQGDGDTALCIFPRRITPNQHKLVETYTLFDHFYVDAEVSADGHNWSTAAYANDFVEKTWITSYGGRGGSYDYEGSRRVAFPKGGFIWDYCQRLGVSYRTYGEFADHFKANYPTLVGHVCPRYSSWDLGEKDMERETVWEHDFDSLLAIGQVPRFNSIRFGNDHTSGMSKGAYSPSASVADNDLAVGRFIAHLSKSKIWAQSAVFILEDDAQNGADHVDAHRSTAYVISPWVKRGFVDHTLYTTSGMLRTMELILGLPPMSQYDAGAVPMWRCFSNTPDLTPYEALPNQVSTDERNLADNDLTRRSAFFNLAELDAVPEREFNEVLWQAMKGIGSKMPAPRRAAWITPIAGDGDDD